MVSGRAAYSIAPLQLPVTTRACNGREPFPWGRHVRNPTRRIKATFSTSFTTREQIIA